MIKKLPYHCLFLLLFSVSCQLSFAQLNGRVKGFVLDSLGKGVPDVAIYIPELEQGQSTNDSGYFSLILPAYQVLTIETHHINYKSKSETIRLKSGETRFVNFKIEENITSSDIVIIKREKSTPYGEISLDPKRIDDFVSASGDALDIIKSLPSVASNNELSSQYSVRGGNFDENLIYVNDIEVFRPFLVRAGQQEGLSFVNSDMIENITFYAGGFEAKYGDKMSSVLDIKYRKPDSLGGSFNVSLLGVRAHVEGKFKKRGTYIVGFRQKSNSYLLNALDTKGDYKPTFLDVQTYVTYPINPRLEIGLLGNVARNKFEVTPADRDTRFGGINQAFQLRVFFEGQEIDLFESYFGALTANYKPNKNIDLKFTSSYFKTFEEENFDILGQYRLNQLETDFGKDNFGDVAFNLGVGSFLNHGRTDLDASIFNLSHRGKLKKKKSTLLWGLKYQTELINDKLKEWVMIDSAGFSLPQKPENEIIFPELINTETTLRSNRYTAFLQKNWVLYSDSSNRQFNLSLGVRGQYWDYNDQLLGSPRALINYIPGNQKDSLKYSFRAAVGVYHQPPFYKELRNRQGIVQEGVQAQNSVHYVIGSDLMFFMWKRPFKLVSEAYFKQLFNLNPYEIDEVRIRYFGENSAKGYATGIEAKLNGEFVKGLESWLSISYMITEEDIENDFYYRYFNQNGEEIFTGFTGDNVATDSVEINPGYLPRPTDQRVAVNLFFQDEMPRFPALKMHLNLSYGTGFPFGPVNNVRARNAFRIPDYRRVDIGFSYQIVKEGKLWKGNNLVDMRHRHLLRFFDSFMIRAEVFNLLDIQNTVSYMWVKDVSNREYAVPNHLTSRLINLRIIGKFN